MSVSAISSQNSNLLAQFLTTLAQDLGETSNTNQTAASSAASTSSTSGTDSSSDSSSMSQMAQLVSQLQQLQTSNPTKFKQIMSEAAQTLDQEAQSTGGMGGQMLSNLAQSFQNAATTGDLSSLLPSGGGSAGQVQNGYNSSAQPTIMIIEIASQSDSSGSSPGLTGSSNSGTGSTDQGQNGWSTVQNDLAALFSQITQQLGSSGS